MTSEAYRVELSRADYTVGLCALAGELARLNSARTKMVFGRLAVAIVTMTVVAYAFPYSLPGLLSACMIVFIGDMLVQAAFKTQTLGKTFDPAVHANLRIEFGNEAIVEQGELRTRRWAWDALRRLHLSPGHVVLELRGWDMIVLPHGLWPTAEAREAFLARIEARRVFDNTAGSTPSAAEAEARLTLTEPVLVARIALAVAVSESILDAQLADGAIHERGLVFLALGSATLGAATAWWISGKVFRWLAARSASTALRVAWGLCLLLVAAFTLSYLRTI